MDTFPDRTFTEYLEEATGRDIAAVALSALCLPPSVSVRLNPFKKGADFPDDGTPVPWSPHGLILKDRPQFTLDPCFHGGGYYVQDSSSMFVGHIFRDILRRHLEIPDRPVRVLDLCAAPGGKTTDLAASLREVFGNSFLLTANETVRQRSSVLSGNTALWGDPNVMVTSADPERVGQLKGMFDIILADVPCSGEGMFRKDIQAREQWSPQTVDLCRGRQRRIIADVWPALAEGGVLIYSTCTFNKYENDGNVDWICRELGASPIYNKGEICEKGVLGTEFGFLLVPGLVPGEGQYCSAVRKEGLGGADRRTEGRTGRKETGRKGSGRKENGKNSAALNVVSGLFKENVRISEVGGILKAVPETIAGDVETVSACLPTLSSGCLAGCFKGKDFIPDADSALSIMLREDAWPRAEVSRETALAFLHRDPVSIECTERGFVLICYKGLPLGYVKNLGNRCNNLHPMSRRIRMDII